MGIEDRSYYRDSNQSSIFRMQPGTGRSMVATLIFINVGIWILDALTPAAQQGGPRLISNFLSLNTDVLAKPWLWWKFLTYGFAHASLGTSSGMWHVAGNMLGLFFLGRAVESKLGRYEFLKFYLISIVVAGLAWTLISLARGVPASIVGASGAVTAVVALFIFSFPHEKVYLFMAIPIPAWVLGVLLIGTDVFRSLGAGSQIAGEAHLAGFAFAAVYHFFKWNFRWLKFDWVADLFSGKPKLRVHNPEATNEKLRAEGDKILEKVHLEGESSLTRRERKILEKYSRLARKNTIE